MSHARLHRIQDANLQFKNLFLSRLVSIIYFYVIVVLSTVEKFRQTWSGEKLYSLIIEIIYVM